MCGQMVLRQAAFCSAADMIVWMSRDRKRVQGRGGVQGKGLMEGEEGWENTGRITADKELE